MITHIHGSSDWYQSAVITHICGSFSHLPISPSELYSKQYWTAAVKITVMKSPASILNSDSAFIPRLVWREFNCKENICWLLCPVFWFHSFKDLLIFILCLWILYVYMCSVCALPIEARRGSWIPWNWSYPLQLFRVQSSLLLLEEELNLALSI